MNWNTLTRAFMAFAVLATVSAASSPVHAQTPRHHPQSDPAAVAIIERSVKAGGTAAQPEFSHWIQEMQVAGGLAIRTEIFMARPDRIYMRNTMAGQTMLEFGFDGTIGWSSSPANGVTRLDGPELEAMRANAAAVSAPSFDTTARLVSIGRSTLEDEPVDGILAIAASGDTVTAYFAVTTGLLVGMRTPPVPGGPPGPGLMLLRDYKPFGGRMTPTTMIMRMGGMEVVSRTVHQDNDPIPPERFKQP